MDSMALDAQGQPTAITSLMSWGTIVGVLVVAVDLGLLQVLAPREGGFLETEGSVDLLLELAVISSVRGRLHHQGHDHVVRVGVLVSGARTETTAIIARANIAFFILLAVPRGFVPAWSVVARNKARNKLEP